MPEKTPLFAWHQAHGGRLVDFAGWSLPVQYQAGIIAEHLACRKSGALFDISHMGRFLLCGPEAQGFLEGALTNDAHLLEEGRSHYSFICDEDGRPQDDAYLFRLKHDEWLLVVNASGRERDWEWLNRWRPQGAEMLDLTSSLGMLAVQGPETPALLAQVLEGALPPPGRGRLGTARFASCQVLVSRSGYTGEPHSFELMLEAAKLPELWAALVEAGQPLGVIPAGLGARDTLRLEAGLPLYGHEVRADLPLLGLPLARAGINLDSPRPFLGRQALQAQAAELAAGRVELVPRIIRPLLALERGMMREGAPVFLEGREVGVVTSGTTVPAWRFVDDTPGDESYTRALGLALLDRGLAPGQEVEAHYRGRPLKARVMKNLLARAGDYCRALGEEA